MCSSSRWAEGASCTVGYVRCLCWLLWVGYPIPMRGRGATCMRVRWEAGGTRVVGEVGFRRGGAIVLVWRKVVSRTGAMRRRSQGRRGSSDVSGF